MRPRPLLAAILLPALFGPPALAQLGAREWSAATKQLEKAIADSDAGAVRSAVSEVARDDSARAVRVVLTALQAARDLGVYIHLRDALASMGSEDARGELLRQARSNSNWALRYACLDAAVAGDEPKGREAVLDAFGDSKSELAILAYRLAGEQRWVEAVEPLLAALERSEGKRGDDRTGEILGALTAITGKEFPDARLWKIWWEANKVGFRPPTGDEREESGAGKTVLDRMRRRRGGDYETITGIREGEIVVVRGEYDEVQSVLEHLAIPHRVIDRTEFKDLRLEPRQILLFNCDVTDFEFSKEEIDRIRAFVGAGGYLFTSDWDLQNVSARAFPTHLGVGGGTEEHKFRIAIAPGAADDPLMRDVFGLNPYESAAMTWQIDGASFLVQVKHRSVKTLVVCEELKKTYGSEVVAVTFQVRDSAYAPPGHVLHVLSHFVAQRDEKEDKFALQQLLLNFLVEKKKAWAAAQRRGR